MNVLFRLFCALLALFTVSVASVSAKSITVSPIAAMAVADEHAAIGIVMSDPEWGTIVLGERQYHRSLQWTEIQTTTRTSESTATVEWRFVPPTGFPVHFIRFGVDLYTREILWVSIA